MTRPDPEYLAWVDLETTGTDETTGHVLEVGVIVTDYALHEQERGRWYVMPPPGIAPREVRESCPPVVQEMHTVSGLWDDYYAAWSRWHEPDGPDRADTGTPGDVSHAIASGLDRYTPKDGQKVGLAGSGVSHFDGRWIRRHLPTAGAMLTYWGLDVGAMRRFLRDVVGAPLPDLIDAQGPTSHRALPDAERSLSEARLYRDLIDEGLTEIGFSLRRPRTDRP